MEHLPYLSNAESKVFLWLLCKVNHRTAEYRFSLRDAADELGMGKTCLSAALRCLSGPHGPKERRFIEYEPSLNQHGVTRVKIENYKGELLSARADSKEEVLSGIADSKGVAVRVPSGIADSTRTAQASDQAKGALNKREKGIRREGEEETPPPSFSLHLPKCMGEEVVIDGIRITPARLLLEFCEDYWPHLGLDQKQRAILFSAISQGCSRFPDCNESYPVECAQHISLKVEKLAGPKPSDGFLLKALREDRWEVERELRR